MFRRSLFAVALAAATLAPVASPCASLFGSNTPSVPNPGKAKMVKMMLKNRTSAPMELLIEDKPVTIAANGEYELRVPEGTRVYGTDRAIKVTVTRDLDGTTCSFR